MNNPEYLWLNRGVAAHFLWKYPDSGAEAADHQLFKLFQDTIVLHLKAFLNHESLKQAAHLYIYPVHLVFNYVLFKKYHLLQALDYIYFPINSQQLLCQSKKMNFLQVFINFTTTIIIIKMDYLYLYLINLIYLNLIIIIFIIKNFKILILEV